MYRPIPHDSTLCVYVPHHIILDPMIEHCVFLYHTNLCDKQGGTRLNHTTPAYIKQYQCCSYHICYCTRVSAGQCTVCKKTQPFPSIFTKNNQCHDTPLSKENYHPFTLFTMDKLLSWCRIIINTDFQYIPDIISISDSKRRIKNCQMWSNSKCQLTPVSSPAWREHTINTSSV